MAEEIASLAQQANAATYGRQAYPGPAHQDHLMQFHAGQYGFSLARADNGVIFQEYEIKTDTTRRLLANSPEQLQAIFEKWFAKRSGEVLKWAQGYFADIEKGSDNG